MAGIRPRGFIPAPGSRFGRLTITNGSLRIRSFWWYNAICDCGKTCAIRIDQLRAQVRVSCGCWAAEALKQRAQAMVTHGGTNTPEYRVWVAMIRRCEDPKQNGYKYYGGRGVKVCATWRKSFGIFIQDMGKRPTRSHTIERKNGLLGYSKENCKWATWIDQANNRSSNRMVEFRGETLTVAEWGRRLNLTNKLLLQRLSAGRSVAEAFTSPVRHKRKRIAHV